MAGVWIYHRDENGLVASASIIVKPCANEPTPDALRPNGGHDWQHGLAEVIRDNGTTLLCRACGDARRSEEGRQARLRALPPFAREFLARNDQEDWKP
jgi:hypothetical protein